jgi:hypothetical protein
MREKKNTFFLRQHIRLSSKTQYHLYKYFRPSNRSDIVRLKFFEYPYRLYYKIPKGIRTAIFAAIWSAIIPYVIYNAILKVVKYEEKVN